MHYLALHRQEAAVEARAADQKGKNVSLLMIFLCKSGNLISLPKDKATVYNLIIVRELM